MAETRVSLIQRVRDHSDESAWEQFVAIYQPLITAYIRKRGVDEHDAADIVQDVFAKLVPAMARFELDQQRGRFRTWLWRVTQNALSDWMRRHATRDRAEQGWIDGQKLADENPPTIEWDELYRHRILEVAFERVRNSVQPATWLCFEQRILAGRPAAEIAEELGVTPNVVYVNASRVMTKVREEMNAFEESLGST